MAQLNNTKKTRKYQHLTPIERGKIEALRNEGLGVCAIARKIGRDKGTVSREVRRGTAVLRQRTKYLSKDPSYPEFIQTHRYYADTGQAAYEKGRQNSRKPRKMEGSAEFVRHADRQMLERKWSPETVCGRARLEGRFAGAEMVCAKTLYNYIGKGLLRTKNIDLPLKVRRKPAGSGTKCQRQNKRVLGASIEERPAEVAGRGTFGHWEIDSVVGRKCDKSVALTIVERKTRFQHADKVYGRKSAAMCKAARAACAGYEQGAFKSVTADNGSEFAGLSKALEGICEVYFCHPYSSWEKGSNERHNGLLRRHVKKGRSIDAMGDETIWRAARWNNELPRKILGWRTPAECFFDEMALLAAQAADKAGSNSEV